MTSSALYIQDCGIVTALGRGKAEVARALFAGSRDGIASRNGLVLDRSVWVGAVDGTLPQPPAHLQYLDCRNNRLMQMALEEIAPAAQRAIAIYGADRVAVVLGTSTSGIAEGEDALEERLETGQWPKSYDYRQQEVSGPALYTAQFFGLTGPSYVVATACSSSAKVFASARRLIAAGLADAVIVGGADTLCRMTLNGFHSLGLLSQERCNPFSLNRNGITIGEGASAFLITKEPGPVRLLGIGETSDAYHLTAPDPEGAGAQASMQQALDDARLKASDIAYINLHGTATPLNDAMEAVAVASLFGNQTPCSSTKGMTGHMLGATGGCEAAFLWLALNPSFNPGLLPPHVWDGVPDPALPVLNFVSTGTLLRDKAPLAMLSNSFGFGGSNATLIFGQA